MPSIFQAILRKTEIINNYFKNFNMADLSGTKIIIIVLIYFWLVKALILIKLIPACCSQFPTVKGLF